MEKLYFKSTGEEVKIGDVLIKHVKSGDGAIVLFKYTLDDKLKDQLLKEGVIESKKPVEQTPVKQAPVNQAAEHFMDSLVIKLSKRLGWNVKKTANILGLIEDINVSALFSILVKEIAVEIDKKYKDHITASPKIYVISTMDGRITEVNKAHIKNYRNFAAFRSIEDAKEACSVLSPILKYMFKRV